MVKLASLLMIHRVVTATLPSPSPYQYQFVMTGPPSQYSRLMVSAYVTGPWFQINSPDGATGQRSGTNFILIHLPDSPTRFFTTKPSP